ncbi:serine hydrolase domain-containing protein [Heyndrickxia sporothermodurans]
MFPAVRKRVFLCILICMIFFPSHLFASETGDVQSKILEVDQYMKKAISKYEYPGASIAIVNNGKVVYTNSWGVTGDKKNVTTDTPFIIGSLSKSMTAFGVMKLVQEGKVNLHEAVQKYIPWFTLKDKAAASKITIEQLLSHTSGLSSKTGLKITDLGAEDDQAIKRIVRMLANEKPTAKPGERYQYCDANFVILGALIEEVTNQTFSQFMDEKIFRPLNMHHVVTNTEQAKKWGLTHGYQSWFGRPKVSSIGYDNGGTPYGYIAVNAEDMGRYLVAMMDGNKVLASEYMKDIFHPRVQIKKDTFYGLGWKVTNLSDTETLIWHSGSMPDYRSEMFMLPNEGWGVAILTNRNHQLEEDKLYHVSRGILDILQGRHPPSLQTYKATELGVLTVGLIGITAIFILLLLNFFRLKEPPSFRWLWPSLTCIYLLLSVTFIPIFIYLSELPWRTIYYFSPDLAFLAVNITLVLFLSGLISIGIYLKTRPFIQTNY